MLSRFSILLIVTFVIFKACYSNKICAQTLYTPYADIPVANIQVASSHPSLFFTMDELPNIKQRSLSLPWLRDTRTEIRKKADLYMELSTTPYALVTQYNGFGTAGRAVQNFIGTLAFASYLFDEPKYLEKAKDLLLAVVEQTEPSNPKHWRSHLQVSDATQGLVMAYDLVYPVLSEDQRALVLEEILKFANELTHEKSAWGMQAPGVMSCNHNAVHYGALGLATLALWNSDIPEKQKWMQRAIGRVDGYLATFIDETGYGTEGHHYYAYGLGGSSVFAWALKRSNGPDLMSKYNKLANAGDQVLWKLLPFEGRMLALNDNNEIPSDVAGMSGTLIHQQPAQLWAWLESLYQSGKKDELAGYARTTYTAPFLFMWGDEPLKPQHPERLNLPLGKHFETGRVFLRSAWSGEDAAHFSMTSGIDFHRGHDHQDENSVTFYANGEGFLIDPEYMPERSEAHTTLKVHGAEQIKGGDGQITKYREDEFGALVHGNAEHAYDFDTAFVGYVSRKAYFVRGPSPYLVMRDDAQVEHDRAGEYVSRYITYKNNTIEQQGEHLIIKGERGKSDALLMVFSEGKLVKVSEDDLQNATFERRGQTHHYAKYFKRASVTVNAVNPKFLSVLIPFQEKDDIPEYKIEFDSENDVYRLLLTFDTYQDELLFNQYDGVLVRTDL